MNVTIDKAKEVARICVDRYFATPPYSDFVQGVSFTTVGLQDPDAAADEKANYCVCIALREPLPPHLFIPATENGVRIYTEIRPEAELASL